MGDWGYGKNNGPATWKDLYDAAGGKNQSPIDIVTSQAEYDSKLASNKLIMEYAADNSKSLSNSGHSFMVEIDTAADAPGFKTRPKPGFKPNSLKGGPLTGEYHMAQFHAHWGSVDEKGSEHTVDGKSYAAEIHLVHFNSTRDKSFGAAVKNEDGLAVLGIFVKIGQENADLKKITDELASVQNSGKKVDLSAGFDPALLLPKNTERYWTYRGSLTTPPCLECVTWIVFEDPIEISAGQVKAFRDLWSYTEGEEKPNDEFCGQIIDNYRPPQELCGRKVRSSFKS